MSKRIPELGVINSLNDTDAFVVETTASGTKQISVANMRKSLVAPTSGSVITAVTKSNQLLIIQDGTPKLINISDFCNSSDRFTDILSTTMGAAAAFHNSRYGGRKITDMEKFYANIKNGTFDDIFPGDYFDMPLSGTDINYSGYGVVADCDPYLNMGDTPITDHHVAIIPYTPILSSYMNATNITTGGYKGSYMFTTTIPKVDAALTSFFGNHLMTHRDILTKTVNTSAASGAGAGWTGSTTDWEWTDVKSVLMSVVEVTGNNTGASSLYDIGMACRQFSVFRLNPNMRIANRNWYWTKCVAYSPTFVRISYDGVLGNSGASDVLGVRPRFLIKG